MTLKSNAIATKAATWPLLEGATMELLYLSETEVPFAAVQASQPRVKFAANDARELTGSGVNERVEELSVSEFFADLTRSQKWHGPHEKQAIEQYRTLHRIFTEELSSSKVFKIGEIKVKILVIGGTSDGLWIGVKTEAVET